MLRTLFLFCGFFPIVLFCQTRLDTIALEGVTVVSNRLLPVADSKYHQQLDSAQLRRFPTSTVAEVLQQQSSVYVKSYGAGSIATTSIQGGGAGHTLVLWNGFPITNASLGQTDFSLLPTIFFDEAVVQYGGDAAIYGNAAIGGVIHLNSHFPDHQKFQFQSGIGSFGKFSNSLLYQRKYKKWSSGLRLLYQQAENDFPYWLSKELPARKLTHAQTEQLGLMQENKLQLSKKQTLTWNIWGQQLQRAIPPTTTQLASAASQLDQSIRTTFSWQYLSQKMVWQARTAFYKERIYFQDSLAGVSSDGKAWTSISEVEQTTNLGDWKIYTGLNFTYLQASTDGYPDGVVQYRLAGFTSIQRQHENWTFALHLRQEWANTQTIPIMPSFTMSYRFHPKIKISVAAARNFRLPSFNDLYWSPGGNPNLLPESGWSQSFETNYAPSKTMVITWSGFNRLLENRILWQPPVNGFTWSPSNVDQVWSRGLAGRWTWNTKVKAVKINLQSGYDYTLSTATKTKDAFSLNKQLIYSPLHQGYANIEVSWKSYGIHYLHHYTGKVLIQHRSLVELPSYQIGNLVLEKNWKFGQVSNTIQLRINNFWNVNYRVIERRPMPGRNFEFNLFFNLI